MNDNNKTKEQLITELEELLEENAKLKKVENQFNYIDKLIQDKEERFKSVISSIDDLVFALDKNGIFIDYYQPYDKDDLYLKPKDFLGKSFKDILPKNIIILFEDAIKSAKITEAVQEFDYSLIINDKKMWFNVKISILKNSNGDFDGISAVSRNITRRKSLEEKLKKAAHTDLLTGLYNRRGFYDKFKTEMSRFKRNHKLFSIIMGDIDFFKKINEIYGHECGVYVIKRISEIIKSSLREQDIVGRWGGEEFIILLPETELEGGKISAEKICKKIYSNTFSYKKNNFKATMSFGVSIYNDIMSMEEICNKTDKCLLKAKKTGRNRVVCCK